MAQQAAEDQSPERDGPGFRRGGRDDPDARRAFIKRYEPGWNACRSAWFAVVGRGRGDLTQAEAARRCAGAHGGAAGLRCSDAARGCWSDRGISCAALVCRFSQIDSRFGIPDFLWIDRGVYGLYVAVATLPAHF